MLRIHRFAVMVTIMQFSQFYSNYKSQELLKASTKEKKHKCANDSFIAVFLLFYDLKYTNST